MNDTPMRRCSQCGTEYPATTEYFQRATPKYLRSRCRDCTTANGIAEKLPDGHKRCTDCKQVLPATNEYYYWQKIYPSGNYRLTSKCKQCISKDQKKYYAENSDYVKARVQDYVKRNPELIKQRRKAQYDADPEVAKQAAKKWREENSERKKQNDREYALKHPDKQAEAKKRYVERHPERALQSKRDWRKCNPQKMRILTTNWRRKNPYETRAIKLRRRARERSLPADFSGADWERALTYFNERCAVCGREPEGNLVLAADHWIPLMKGGGTTKDNIIPLCHSQRGNEYGCNNTKSHRDALEWLTYYFREEKALEVLERISHYFDWVKVQKE